MAIKSISEFYSYYLYIFDLDNTIYDETDYLFQAYDAIAEYFSGIIKDPGKKELSEMLKRIYHEEGHEKMFNKFLMRNSLDENYIRQCLAILRSFKVEKDLEIITPVKKILKTLTGGRKKVYVLTNGNVQQQKNKIKSISWDGLDRAICFVFAEELEPKPSPAGIGHILQITGIPKHQAVLTGDAESDRLSAESAGINFVETEELLRLGKTL
jgi:FMN phosphatase YigB (HAD superfamily)